jgi:hypothetical protein
VSVCLYGYILQLGKKPRFWHEKHLLNPVYYVLLGLALLDPLDEQSSLGWGYFATWKADIIFFMILTYFLFCLYVAAIILVATIYYYSQPVGIKTWIRALLYPSCVQSNIGLVLKLHFLRPKTWSNPSLLWLCFRYCAIAPTILAGQIDPVLFEALYVSSIFYFLVCSWTYVVGVCHSSIFACIFTHLYTDADLTVDAFQMFRLAYNFFAIWQGVLSFSDAEMICYRPLSMLFFSSPGSHKYGRTFLWVKYWRPYYAVKLDVITRWLSYNLLT